MLFSHVSRRTKQDYIFNDKISITIDRFSYVAEHANIITAWFLPEIIIGSFTGIAANSRFFTRQNHHPEWISSFPIESVLGAEAGAGRHDNLKSRIVIGHDVWIGDGATILPGVTIGDGAVIGANAVVAKDVPAYSIHVGNPGQTARLRFAEEVVEKLLKIQWWHWEEARIREMAHLIWSPDIESFLAAAGQ